jgi:hypothetical protein
MTGGRINIYADPVFDFATSAANYGADNGKLVGSFSQGYLFTANGTDMASLSGVKLQLNIANNASMPDDLIVSEIICGLAAACGGGSFALSQQAFTVQDSGSVNISAVPEPEAAAMLLAGLGLIAGMAHSRRKSAR